MVNRPNGRSYPTLGERLFSRVVITDAGCWEYQGHLNRKGYGQLRSWGSVLPAHRASWLLSYGQIPIGMQVLHRCDNPPCVNTDHLFLGTIADNMRDRDEKGRVARGERSGVSKVTQAQVDEIRRRHRKGIHASRKTGGSSTELAGEFSLTPQQILTIVRGESWRVRG